MPARIILPYGTSRVSGSWPARVARLASHRARAARDPHGAVHAALDQPTGIAPLREHARGARAAVVVVSDHTRQTAAPTLLGPVFEALAAGGVDATRVSVLVAYGNHARASAAQLRQTLGPLPGGATLVHHDATDEASLTDVGALPAGEHLRLNRLAVEAPLLVVTGAITFHYHAGFTGGRKALLPGIAARENILANHARTLSEGDPGGRSRGCGPGRLEGNPVAEQMDAAARLVCARAARRPFLVNATLTEGGALAAVFAGDLFDAFSRGAAWVDDRFRAPVDRPFDVAIASAGGAPRDGSFYQAHKAFDHAARAVRDGGVVVLAAECPEGAGAGFLDWFAFDDYTGHLEALRRCFAVPGQTALALRQKLARVRGVLVSRMSRAEVTAMGLTPAASLGEALALARGMVAGRRARTCVIPHASMVLPSVGEGPR